MNVPVIVLGNGGHAKVLIDALLRMSVPVLGFTTPEFPYCREESLGVPLLGDDQIVMNYQVDDIYLVNGIGSAGDPANRIEIYERFKRLNYVFANVIHPAAVISAQAELLEGVQAMAGAIVQAGSRIGSNVIINTNTSVDHDCQIGNHVHLAPGVTISGGVFIGDRAHIGTGATVIQQVKIGANSLIGAGAVVIRDVPDNAVVVGVPGKIIKHR